MKPFSLIIGCLVLATGFVAVAAAPEGEVEARQAPSCGEWIAHREKSDTLALGNSSWLLGYLSGVAVSTARTFLSETDNRSIFKWMDIYCRANPLKNLASGGNALAAELTRKKEDAK